jgi:hypothetical protein
MRHLLVPVLFVALIQTQASTVRADPANDRSFKAGDYSYVFHDDPLAAGGFGPNDARIPIRPMVCRTMLIRSRTDFVPELLKAVEDI